MLAWGSTWRRFKRRGVFLDRVFNSHWLLARPILVVWHGIFLGPVGGMHAIPHHLRVMCEPVGRLALRVHHVLWRLEMRREARKHIKCLVVRNSSIQLVLG